MAFRPAMASMSLGRAWVHQIPEKFAAAAAAGIPGIEIFYEDLEYLAASYPCGLTPTNQILAARHIRTTCDSLNLEIMAIGPFKDFEGRLDAVIRAEKIEEMKLWFKIARILGTDIIQIPCHFMTEGVTGDLDVVAGDLREIAEMGAREQPPFRFAFENLCWGTYISEWEKAWEVVKAVDRDNFGLCLDTFNIAGRAWADPASPSGAAEDADKVFKESLRRMVAEVDVSKVFYVQVVDAERMSRPLDEKHYLHVDGQRPRMSWSRSSRLFMFEEDRGGYLPVLDVLKAICDEKTGLGYKGWISAELFNGSLLEKGEHVPREHAVRCMASWWKIVKAMGWESQVEPKRIKTVCDVHQKAEIMARL